MTLLKWAAVCFLVSIVAGLLGFTGVAAGSAALAQVFFYLFLGICVLLLAAGLIVADKVIN